MDNACSKSDGLSRIPPWFVICLSVRQNTREALK